MHIVQNIIIVIVLEKLKVKLEALVRKLLTSAFPLKHSCATTSAWDKDPAALVTEQGMRNEGIVSSHLFFGIL